MPAFPDGMEDLSGYGSPPLAGIGDSRLIQGEADNRRTILPDERQDPCQALLFTGNRIYQHLAVGRLEPPFQGVGIGGIDNQRSIHRSRNTEYRPLHGGRLVDPRCAHIDIEQVRTGRCLFHCFTPDIGDLPLRQFGGEPLLAGRVDPLTDDSHRIVPSDGNRGAPARKECNSPGGAALAKALILSGQCLPHGPDMGRRGAAAAADDPDPQVQQPVMIRNHVVRCMGEKSFAVLQLRQARIGLAYQGKPGDAAHGGKDVIDTVHPQAAVGPDDVRARRFQGNRRRLGRSAENAPSLVVEGEHGNDRNPRSDFPDGNDPGPEFLDIEKRLERKGVNPRLQKRFRLLPVYGAGFVEGHVPERLHKTAGRSERGGHVTGSSGNLSGDGDRRGVDLPESSFQSVMGKFRAVAAESVGDDDVRSRFQVFPVDPGNDLGHGQVQLLGRLPRLQAPFLEHGPHGTVQDKHPIAYRFHKWLFHGIPHNCGESAGLRTLTVAVTVIIENVISFPE